MRRLLSAQLFIEQCEADLEELKGLLTPDMEDYAQDALSRVAPSIQLIVQGVKLYRREEASRGLLLR